MFKQKCPNCAKKIEKDYNFCPYCGLSFKQLREEENFGLLGRDDEVTSQPPIKLPMGLDKIMNSLIKQLEKQTSNAKEANVLPRGFSIQISTAPRQTQQNPQERISEPVVQKVPVKEIERRRNLPKKEAESSVRRLSDKIIYEIFVPKVKNKKDVVISRMETGIEIKAYSKDACFYKTIPVKLQILRHYLKDSTLFLEFKS